MRAVSLIASMFAAMCLAGCASTNPEGPVRMPSEMFRAGSIWEQVPAEIAFVNGVGELTREIHAPSTVRAGQPLMVDVTSYGGGCEARGSGEVVAEGLEADIRVFEYTYASPPTPGLEHLDRICTTQLKLFHKRFAVHFQKRGEAVVRVHGVRSDARVVGRTPEVVTLRVQVR